MFPSPTQKPSMDRMDSAFLSHFSRSSLSSDPVSSLSVNFSWISMTTTRLGVMPVSCCRRCSSCYRPFLWFLLLSYTYICCIKQLKRWQNYFEKKNQSICPKYNSGKGSLGSSKFLQNIFCWLSIFFKVYSRTVSKTIKHVLKPLDNKSCT